MAEFLLNVTDGKLIQTKDRDNAHYQCFYSNRRGLLSFVANYKIKLTDTYKEVKHNSKLWNNLLYFVSQL